MDRIHNTRRRTAPGAVEATANLVPKLLGQIRQEAAPQPVRRGRERGRVTGASRGRGRGMASAGLVYAVPLPEPQIQPNLTTI